MDFDHAMTHHEPAPITIAEHEREAIQHFAMMLNKTTQDGSRGLQIYCDADMCSALYVVILVGLRSIEKRISCLNIATLFC